MRLCVDPKTLTAPRRLPRFRMMSRYAQADFLAKFKTSIWLKECEKNKIVETKSDSFSPMCQDHTVKSMTLGGFMGYSGGKSILP